MRPVVGIDLGGTKTAAALVAPDGTLGVRVEAPTPAAEGPDAVLDVVAGLVARVAGDSPIGGVGIGTAGIVDAAGRVVSATETFAGWVGTDLVAGVGARLPAPVPIRVYNDVDAHLLGEAWQWAARGHSSVLMVAVGTGVGGALLIDGRLVRGAHGAAGEVGHMPAVGAEGLRCPCGRYGHLEALAAGPAIARGYRAAGGTTADGTEADARVVFGLAERGDPLAAAVVQAAAAGLGRAIAGLVTTIDPGCVVIGGGVAEAGEPWWRPLREAFRSELVAAFATPLVKAQLGVSAAVLGAARGLFDDEGA